MSEKKKERGVVLDSRGHELLEYEGSLAEALSGLARHKCLHDANLAGARLHGVRLGLRGICLQGADLSHAELLYADLRGVKLDGASLLGAALRGADLRATVVSSADLRRADLRGACLDDAALRGFTALAYARLEGASVERVHWPSPPEVLRAQWDKVSDELCADLMVYDASCHPDPAAFDAWADDGPCPYGSTDVDRAAYFSERAELWGRGELCRPYDLMRRLLAEKCPEWTAEQRAEFKSRYAVKP